MVSKFLKYDGVILVLVPPGHIMSNILYDALRNLVLLTQFRKREKRLWRSVTFSKVTGLSLQLY